MKGIQNQYNEIALARFQEIAAIAFDLARQNKKDFAVRVGKLGRIGPNGLVKMHIRACAFFPETSFCEGLAAILALADDVSFALTDDCSEIMMTVGVKGIVMNWEDSRKEEFGWREGPEGIES